MFPFRKPPTKLEIAKKSVSDAAHTLIDALPVAQIEDKFDDLKKSAALAAGAATVAVAGAAHHAGEVASHGLESLQNTVSHFGEGAKIAAQNAQNAGQSAASIAAEKAAIAAAKAGAATQTARESLGEKAQTARVTLGETAKTATDFAGNLRERAAHNFAYGSKEAQNAKAVAQKAAEREASAIRTRLAAVEAKKQAKALEKEAEAAQKEADKTVREAQAAQEQARIEAQKEAEQAASAIAVTEAAVAAEARELSDKAAKKAVKAEAKAAARARDEEEIQANRIEKAAKFIDADKSELSEIQIKESSSNFGWILLGLAIGAVVALLLAPTSGRRSRAAIKDRLGKVGDGAVDATTATADKVVDIAQRVEGLTHKIEIKLAADGEGDDDATVADRVRSILGHHEAARGIERLNIDCADGVVTLRGVAVDAETQETLMAAIRTVPGVKDVIAEFVD